MSSARTCHSHLAGDDIDIAVGLNGPMGLNFVAMANIQIIGEAVNQLADDVKTSNPQTARVTDPPIFHGQKNGMFLSVIS